MNAYAVMCELKQLCDKSRKRCFITRRLLHVEEERSVSATISLYSFRWWTLRCATMLDAVDLALLTFFCSQPRTVQ